MDRYIITKQEIDGLEGLNKTHFLNDDAQRINKSLGDLTGLTGFGFHIIEVPPGKQSTEMHRHHHEDECVFILEGEGDAVIGDEARAIGPGDFIGYRAGGEAHTLVNTGVVPLKCIVVGQRLDHDVGDYPRLGKRLYRHRNLPWNLVDVANISEPVAGKK